MGYVKGDIIVKSFFSLFTYSEVERNKIKKFFLVFLILISWKF